MLGIPEAMASLAAIKSIAEGFVATRDETKVMGVKLDLMKRAFEIQQALNALQDELSAVKTEKAKLEQENLHLHQRLGALDEYDLVELVGGVRVLAQKPVRGDLHQPPYFCQACHNDGKKSALSLQASVFDFDPAMLRCVAQREHSLELPSGTSQKDIAHPVS